MAKTSNITILWEDDTNLSNYATMEVDSTASGATDEYVAPGDLVEIKLFATDNRIGAVDTVESELFAGVAKEYGTPGDLISVCLKCVIEGKMASAAAVSVGEGVAYSAGDNGTAWTFAKAANVNLIGWAMEPIAVGSSGKILIDVKALHTVTSSTSPVGLGPFKSGSIA